jgi:hypothetical protein
MGERKTSLHSKRYNVRHYPSICFIFSGCRLAGFIPKKILSRLQDFTLQEWPSLAGSLNTHEQAFFTVKEEALYEK